MKKFLLSCMCLLGLATASATTTEWVASAQGYGNGEVVSTITIDNGAVTITLDKGTNSNTPKYYTGGSAIRLYGGNTMTFTAKEGVVISNLVFTTGSGNNVMDATASVGTLDVDGTTATWTGTANEMTLTENGTSGHARIQKIEITYSESGATFVATPRFTPGAGEVALGTEVEIACSTEGAEIHYTVDGTEPTPNSTLYTAPIAVNEAMTIKAVAVLDGNMSDVAVAEYTIKPQAEVVDDIAAWLDAENTDDFLAIGNPVTAVYQNGSNLYVKDNSGWLLIYGNVGKTYNNGDQLPAGLAGKYKDFNGLPEMVDPDADTFGAGVAGTPVEPTPIYTIDDVSAEPLNSYIELQDVTLGAASGKNIPVTDVNGSDIKLYNTFNIQIPEGEGYNVRGFISIYNGTYQITPVEAYIPGVVPTVEAPTFSVAAGEVLAGTSVTISCATEGATIYYTVDGVEPTEASAVYAEPIVINEATTLKAVAMKEGMNPSEVAVAEYTIYTPAQGEVVTYFVAPGYDASNLVGNVVVLGNRNGNNEPAADDAKVEENSLCGTVFSSDYVDMVINHGDGQYYSTVFNTEVRFYQGDVMTVTPKANNRVVKMYFNTVANSKGGVKVTVNGETTGVVEGTGVGASNPITWVGEFTTAADVTALKQVRFNYLRIETASTTGIENVGIEADENAPVEFYNLQGVRVANPENGLYIRVQGKTATKVLVK